MGVDAPESQTVVTGPVRTYAATPFSERAWCDRCGSALWLRNTAGAHTDILELVPGIFENAGGETLTRVVYADCATGGIKLAGDLQRVSKAEYEREHDHV
jgi:hypothetical protein